MNEHTKELVGCLSEECSSMQDVHDLLKELFKGTIEQMLEACSALSLRESGFAAAQSWAVHNGRAFGV